MSCTKNPVCAVACILVVVGALNWGLVGLGSLVADGANWNIVNLLLGTMPMVEAIVYVLVGLAGVYKLIGCMKGCSGNSACCK